MKKTRTAVLCLFLASASGAALADNAADMMEQYKQMGAGTEKNFPKAMTSLMPKEFTVKSKAYVYQETSKMFMFMALSGTRKNVEHKKFGHDAEIEIGIMAYNPASAQYMASQYTVILQETRKGYAAGSESLGGGWEVGKVAVSKINGADVYIQKGVRRNVDLDDHKTEDQVYYFAKAVAVKKNVMLTVRIVYYPAKEEGVTGAIRSITGVFNATDFAKYMP